MVKGLELEKKEKDERDLRAIAKRGAEKESVLLQGHVKCLFFVLTENPHDYSSSLEGRFSTLTHPDL